MGFDLLDWRAISIFCALSLTAGCVQDMPLESAGFQAPRVILADSPVNQSDAMFRNMASAPPPYWKPSTADIATLERLLPEFLASSNTVAKNDILPKLSTYARQYFGYMANDTRLIYVNALCPSHRRDTAAALGGGLVVVLDGGSCYFQVHYDVTRQRFERLNVNGEA